MSATGLAQSPELPVGLMVEGAPVDLEKLRQAVTAATTGISSPEPDTTIPRAMPATPIVPTGGQSEPLPPPTELPPVPSVALPLPTPLPPVGSGGPPGVLSVDGVPVDPASLRFRWGGGCSTCGSGDCGGGLGCPGSRHCLPGKKDCEPFPARNAPERFVGLLYETICCPDPCYEPRWEPLANAAFFVDPVRPATQTRFRWDRGYNVRLPDRAEYFWARADGQGLGPRPFAGVQVSPRVDFHELTMYTEAARGSFSVWTELPYRNSDPILATGGSGFGDMKVGTKSVIFDRELVQIAFQMTTHIPTGNAMKGLGVEHVSLEPSIIMGLRLTPTTYFQGQIAEWIPLGGSDYAGAILNYHLSMNQTVWQPVTNVLLISTWEFNGWTFQDGGYTDPVLGPGQRATGQSYFSGGPGLRLSICDNLDFGVGSAFALSYPHWAATQFRFEMRYRY